MRRAVVALGIACAVAQLAPGSHVLASILLALHDHAHSPAWVSDRGHVDLVFSHGEPRREHGDQAGSSPHDDHVIHLRAEDPTGTAPRPAVIAPPPAIATAIASLPLPGRNGWPPSSHERPSGPDSRRSVVLRL